MEKAKVFVTISGEANEYINQKVAPINKGRLVDQALETYAKINDPDLHELLFSERDSSYTVPPHAYLDKDTNNKLRKMTTNAKEKNSDTDDKKVSINIKIEY